MGLDFEVTSCSYIPDEVYELMRKREKEKQEKWDKHFLDICLQMCKMSKDPSTQVGSIVVGPDLEIRSSGFNGFPRGVSDNDRLHNRDEKLKYIVHAEMNAICHSARIGVSLKGCTLYLVATDGSGDVWGGAPCMNCTKHVIQAGIKQVVTYPFKNSISRWKDEIEQAENLLREAGVIYREVERKT